MSYRPCTYTAILEEVLSRPRTIGQGGHWEAISADEVSRALVRLSASCDSFLASEMKESLGPRKAKKILRQAIRHFGQYRGEAMRRNMESRGLPLDVLHLLEYWDLPSPEEAWTVEDRIALPHYVAYDVPYCPFHDIRSILCPQELSVLMCEESHIAVAKGFNPAIDVWYPALLTRGQSKCIFRFSMPIEAAEEASQRASQVNEEKPVQGPSDAATSYRLLARLHVLFYHFITDELLRNIGSERTEDLLRRAMYKWGIWRGKDMQEDHRARGWPRNVESLITYFDDPAAGDAWVAQNVRLTASEHHKEVTASAYSTTFEQLGTGRFAAIFFEQTLPAQARAYNSKIRVTIPQLKERGDPVSQFQYIMVE